MKKAHVVLLTAAIVGITVFESCKKYEEGPGISFRSRKERIANTWKVEKYTVGGTDETSSFNILTPDYRIILDKEGAATATFTNPLGGGTVTSTGTWELITDDEEIKVSFGNSISIYQIIKLKEKELWIVDKDDMDDSDDDKEYHLVPAE